MTENKNHFKKLDFCHIFGQKKWEKNDGVIKDNFPVTSTCRDLHTENTVWV